MTWLHKSSKFEIHFFINTQSLFLYSAKFSSRYRIFNQSAKISWNLLYDLTHLQIKVLQHQCKLSVALLAPAIVWSSRKSMIELRKNPLLIQENLKTFEKDDDENNIDAQVKLVVIRIASETKSLPNDLRNFTKQMRTIFPTLVWCF